MNEYRIALRNVGHIDPSSIEEYIRAGGYHSLARARSMEPGAIIAELERSGRLRGRGGAGFNTGFKWRSAAQAPGDCKYVICNADEGEPGTYKDRIILENDPHTLLEGMLICAHAIGAKQAIVYCRAEYPDVIRLLRHSIAAAEEKGLTGNVKMSVHSGAGAYVCGEETALLNSLEGKRGEPRLKPPYPTIAGYRGKPTVVNNVETFSAVPSIIEKGAQWYSSLGSPKYTGTKIFTLSGDVVNPTYAEVPCTVTLRQLIYDFGGGIRDGKKLKAVQVGGNSGVFLTEKELDTPMDFESVSALGAALGSGSLMVLSEERSMLDVVLANVTFSMEESCGKCVPCREGTMRLHRILTRISEGKGTARDLTVLKELGHHMNLAAFCPLGQSAAVPVLSALEKFPGDFPVQQA